MDEETARIETEIRRIEQRWSSIFRHEGAARRLPARWVFTRRVLRWMVVLDEVLEPDVDIEIQPQALIVRARAQDSRRTLFMELLPVPGDFDAVRARMRVHREVLEIEIVRSSDAESVTPGDARERRR